MMSIRRFALAGLAALGIGGGGALLSAAPGLAAVGYTTAPSAVFGTAGSGNGQLSEPVGVAVNEATGDVYVADKGNKRVEEFDASGKYLGQWGGGETPTGSFSEPTYIAVDNSSSAAKGDVYVADFGSHVIDVFSAAGKYITQVKRADGAEFAELQGVVVGASGEVWVYDGAVSEFSDTGAQLAEFGTGRGFGSGLAVDSAGGVYVLFGGGGIGKFHPTGASSAQQVGEWGAEGAALAVNLASDNVFLDQADRIQEYQPFGEPSGSVVETFANEGLAGSQGLAIDDGDGTIYATQRPAGSVAVFEPVLLAGVSTGPASSVEKTAATISGTVSREGLPTKYHFQYGETSAYGSSTATTDVVGEEEGVTATLSGLAPGTTYHYRLVAEDSNGASPGTDRTFTTAPAVDSVHTEAASSVGRAGATLHGSLAPDGTDAHYYFEYGLYQGYGSTIPVPGADAGSASKDEHFEVALEGLLPSTTYHYRIVAVNSLGTTYGEDAEFTTQPAVDGVLTEGASGVSATGATFNGSLAPDGTDAHYYFEYGENQGYGSTSPAPPGADAGSETKAVHAETVVTGLHPLTTYHYRIVAVNSFGTTYGEDRTVATLGAPPAVNDQPPAVSNILRTSALVAATINSENSPTVFHTEFVAAGAYAPGAADPYADGGSSQSYAVSAGHNDQAMRPLSLSGLLPSTTYHYRLVATNATGTTYGPDYTFTTAPATPPGVQANAASAVTQTTATLSGTVEAQGLQTSYEFEVGLDATYSGAKLFGNAGQSAGSEAVSASLQFLVPGTTYHYRLVAANADGTTYGPDMTFTTPGVPEPIVQPLATQLIPSPAVQFPSVAGAITQGSGKSTHKAKKKAKPRKRAEHKHGVRKRHAKRGGKRGK